MARPDLRLRQYGHRDRQWSAYWNELKPVVETLNLKYSIDYTRNYERKKQFQMLGISSQRGKVKEKLSVCLIKYNTTTAYGGTKLELHAFLT